VGFPWWVFCLWRPRVWSMGLVAVRWEVGGWSVNGAAWCGVVWRWGWGGGDGIGVLGPVRKAGVSERVANGRGF
jgi:hypothetical protein